MTRTVRCSILLKWELLKMFEEKKPFFGGWFKTSDTPLSDSSETFDVYDTTIGDYRGKEVPVFYDHYLLEYEENEWFSFLIDYLVGELFTDYYFVGEGAEDVERFFEEVDPLSYDEVELMGLNVIREGTGALKKYWVDGELAQVKAMNGRLLRLNDLEAPAKAGASSNTAEREDSRFLQVTVESDPKFLVNMKTWRVNNTEDYRDSAVALCRIKRDARSPYGIPFGKSSFHVIKALKDINRDILASVKHQASNLKVIRADLSGLDTDTDKQAALEGLTKAYDKIATATRGVIAIDNHHEVGYMGTQGGGNSDGRLLEIMKHIEPCVSALLMNYLFAIGLVEQTGANKSIISRQEIRAERQIERYRRAVGRFFETQIFPDITDKPCRLVFKKYYEPEIWLKLWEKNVVSLDKLLEEFAIVDKGDRYYKDVVPPKMNPFGNNPGRPAGEGGNADSKADESNDDSSDQRSREEEQ